MSGTNWRYLFVSLVDLYKFAIVFLCLTDAYSPPIYSPCHNVSTKYGSVCVCSESYCDGFSAGGTPLDKGGFAVYTSSSSGARFHLETGIFKKKVNDSHSTGDEVVLKVNSTTEFQEILGFGGAFTGMICFFFFSPFFFSKIINILFGRNGGGKGVGRGRRKVFQ